MHLIRPNDGFYDIPLGVKTNFFLTAVKNIGEENSPMKKEWINYL